ncbi:hypothetical protein [Phenylobacterium sp.]|uniref:hypothetical protein n=1 Tax=Phenylobacterium sp. TaxID=1871053 RepID=UPI004036DC30
MAEAIAPIATWACLFTMVVEFAHIETMATPPDQRLSLMTNLIPPEGWTIWLGRYEGTKWPGAFNHFGLGGHTAITTDAEPIPSALNPWHFAQSTAFCVGSLFLFTFSTRVGHQIDADKLASVAGLRCIWPTTRGDVEPPERILDDFSADQVSRLCLPASSRPFVRPVWETV